MYITLEDFKRDLAIPADNISSDAQLTDFIERAQAMIDKECRRTFEASANTTRYFHAIEHVRGLELWLDRDLAAIHSITNGDGTEIASDQYMVIPANAIADGKPIEAIRLKRNAGVQWTYEDGPEEAIAISGKWAYSVTAPHDIQQATFRLAYYLYQQKDNAADIDRPVLFSGSGSTMVLPPRLPDDVRKILAPYVRRTVTA